MRENKVGKKSRIYRISYCLYCLDFSSDMGYFYLFQIRC